VQGASQEWEEEGEAEGEVGGVPLTEVIDHSDQDCEGNL